MVRALAVLLVLCSVSFSWAADQEEGICDTSAQRERKSIQYNVTSRQDTDSSFVAKRPCSGETITIKRCAVIAVQQKKIERICFEPGIPDHSEYFDIVEYWDKQR